MRSRTILVALAGVLLANALIVLGAWIWFRESPAAASELPVAKIETTPLSAVEPEVSAVPQRSAPDPQRVIRTPDANELWAAIDAPREGESVPRRFQATGRFGTVPVGSRLMLVVDSGRGVYSPKMPPVSVNEHNWSGTVGEFGAPAGGNFFLCVFAVSDEGLQQIAAWHAQGRATGKYPPFRQGVPGGVPLARIKLRVAGNN